MADNNDDNDDNTSSGHSDSIPSYTPFDDVSYLELFNNKISNDKELSTVYKEKYNSKAALYWNKFYSRNEIKFFKDRHYIIREFQELGEMIVKSTVNHPYTLLEVGCGVGNTFFPLMNISKSLKVYATDFSKKAIECIKSQERYEQDRCTVWVSDITKEPVPLMIHELNIPLPLVDVVTLIFVLSAMPHDQHKSVLEKIYSTVIPGGYVFLRDYARYDMTQMRFKSGSKLNDNLYCRWDGTLTAYVTREETKELFESCGFILKENLYHRKKIINRKSGISMNRVWIQVRAYKPKDEEDRQYWLSHLEDIKLDEAKKIKECSIRLAAKNEEKELDLNTQESPISDASKEITENEDLQVETSYST